MTIRLPDYNIEIGNANMTLNHFLSKYAAHQIFIIVDENTREHCLPKLDVAASAMVIEIPSGETAKHIGTCQVVWKSLLDASADRSAWVLNLGGGVIGDMGGFCAATYKRGLNFIQIPTTLLSQVDASVGGKLGIDYLDVKNSIGLFQNPALVVLDTDFLHSLPSSQVQSGFAEILKHTLIDNAAQWEELKSLDRIDEMNWADWVPKSVVIKKDIVLHDPFEHSIRKKLNFGHTIGHAIESHFLGTMGELLHGDAIAWGMLAECHLSNAHSSLTDSSYQDIFSMIVRIFRPKPIPKDSYPHLIEIMKNDKKNKRGRINFTLLERPGKAHINHEFEPDAIIDAINAVNIGLIA